MLNEFVLDAGRLVPIEGDPSATAIHVRDGVIVSTGGTELVQRAVENNIEVIDRRNETVLPGFVDPHVHFEHLAVGRARGVDCRYPTCKSVADVLDALASAEPYEGWLLGYGNLFLDSKLADRRLPTREELDSVSTTVPIVIQCGGHMSVLNSAAIRLIPEHVFAAGASGLWGAPRIDRDEHGELTGVVAEVDGHLPIPHPSREERVQHLREGAREIFLRYGVTTLGEMVESLDSAELLDELTHSDDIAQRVRGMLMVPTVAPGPEAIDMVAEDQGKVATAARFALSAIKVFADGGYSARNAAATTPYLEEQAARRFDRGRINLGHNDIRQLLSVARYSDVRLAIHANGARAQQEALQAIIDSGDPLEHQSPRIEHLGNVVQDLSILSMIKRANATPVMQPGFLHAFIGDFVPMVLGDAVQSGRMPLRTILDDAIVPAISSDVGLGADDAQSNPLFTCDVAHRRYSYWGREIEPWESISIEESLRLHTLEAAKSLSLDSVVGSLVPGKQADFIVYDQDPRGAGDEVASLTPQEVYVAGKAVHTNG